jgi:hypothetical protein
MHEDDHRVDAEPEGPGRVFGGLRGDDPKAGKKPSKGDSLVVSGGRWLNWLYG